jgi:hypothetical protein
MAEPKDWKSWLPEPKGWTSWLPEPKGWKSWLPEPKGWKSWLPEPKGWKSWRPESKGWKSWTPEPKGWKSWMPEPKGRRSWMSQKQSPNQGVVKRDWVATGRIDFATRLNGDAADANQPNEFKLLVEERRIVESIAGNENLEIQWRLATLKEAKAVGNSIPQIPVGKFAHQNCSRNRRKRGAGGLHPLGKAISLCRNRQ